MGLVAHNTKCQHIGKPGNTAPSGDKLSHILTYTGTDMMPLVNEANPAMHLLDAPQHMGCNCPCGTSCKMIHDLNITKWPDATFAKWPVLVDQTPALEWTLPPALPSSLHLLLLARLLQNLNCKTNP